MREINKPFGNEENSAQLADNLQNLLKANHLTLNQIAKDLEMPVMTVRRLFSGETSNPRISTLKLLADYFKVSIDALITKRQQASNEFSKKTKTHFLPLLKWSTVKKINTIKELDLNSWNDWQVVTLDEDNEISASAFALTSRPSMSPRFPLGSIFIIDPETQATDGDIILIKFKKNDELTLRKLILDPPQKQLQSIITEPNIFPYVEKEHVIIGVNILTIFYNRQ